MSYRWIASSLVSIIAVTQAREKHAGCFYGATMYPWSAAQRPGMGQFWPEDIDTSLCDVIYYGFGTLLNETYEVCSWDPVFDLGPDDMTRGTPLFRTVWGRTQEWEESRMGSGEP